MARILVVDDESNIRLMVRIALQAAGHAVETAGDGPEALEKFATGEGWDLVLLDQRMPGMEGLQVLEAMRGRDPQARVVMITAFGTIDLAASAMKLGAMDFLRKPFTTETLRGAVQAALDEAASDSASTTSASGRAANGAQTNGAQTTRIAPLSAASINGFRIAPGEEEGAPSAGASAQGGTIRHLFKVRGPQGECTGCEVVLPSYFTELVKAHADREQIPDAEHFWLWLCEEALANHLWQNAELPQQTLQVSELTTSLRRWVDAVLTR